MTETSNTSNIPSTESIVAPTPAVAQVKPYDDELLEVYASESQEGAVEEGDSKSADTRVEEPKSVERPEAPEDTEQAKEEKPEEEAQAKATKDDKVIDGVEELPVKRIINGKEVEFKVKDAIEAFTRQEEFNRNMDRRLSEVSKRERAWKLDQDTFKDKVGLVIDAAQKGDFVSGIRALAKIAAGSSDLDVVKFEKMYFDQLDKVNEIYTKMTPEQREAYFAKRQAAEAQAEAEKLRGEKANIDAQSQLKAKVQGMLEQYELPESEFWGNYKLLADKEVGEGKPFQSPDDITAEDVLKYSLNVRHWTKIYEAGAKAGIDNEEILDEVGRMAAARPDLTVDDIVKAMKNAGLASPSVVENLNRKVGKSQPNSTASSTKKANGKAEGLDGEDLDFLYRNQPKSYARIIR